MTPSRNLLVAHLFDAWWARHQGAALACTHEALAVMRGVEIGGQQ